MKILAPITENQDIANKKYVDDSIPTIPVTDVQIDSTSIVSNGVATIPYADVYTPGVIKTSSAYYGIEVNSSGYLWGTTKTYQQYSSANEHCFINKGTLDNVIAQAITTALNTPV